MAKKFSRFMKVLWKDDAGATAVEYGLIAALIAVVIIVVLTALGTDLRNMFNQAGNLI